MGTPPPPNLRKTSEKSGVFFRLQFAVYKLVYKSAAAQNQRLTSLTRIDMVLVAYQGNFTKPAKYNQLLTGTYNQRYSTDRAGDYG